MQTQSNSSAIMRPRSSRFARGVLLSCAVLAASAFGSASSFAQSRVVAWGREVFDSAVNDKAVVELAAGYWFGLARHDDGSISAWGYNDHDELCLPKTPSRPLGRVS